MYATLWQLICCIMFDEHLNSDFWSFAKQNNLLTNEQIRKKQNETNNKTFVTFEPKEDTPYIDAFFEFLKTKPTENSKAILITLEYLRSRQKQY